MSASARREHVDVVIIGAGEAGLTLARQLLLASDRITILHVDRRAEVPPRGQKVGEATVQVSAYYLSKVLDLEEHLLREHFMKYNLRFYWKTPGRANARFEDYSQSYIRPFSNIATYQLDRNKIEGELLRLNLASPRYAFHAPVTRLAVGLSETGPHQVAFTAGGNRVSVEAGWVVDTSGRGSVLARDLGLRRPSAIHHGASFLWVDGLLDIERLTDLTPTERRLKKDRGALGHSPIFLATNHFMGEGFWFWVIPLQGKTSLGLVYDNRTFPVEKISTRDRLVRWVQEEFPLFARDLPHRRILHHGSYRDYAYDCVQTISRARWALSGEAGRFTDPLYSPGGDIISIYNTLITDAILTPDDKALGRKAAVYEHLMRAVYEAYVPSFAVSYDALGDHEAMTLKYTWELSIYFAFYVFPFINDLFTDLRFVGAFLERFTRLGPLNRRLQAFFSAFYRWRRDNPRPAAEPLFVDFLEVGALGVAQSTFYEVGVPVAEATRILDAQLANLEELARFIAAHAAVQVTGDESLLTDRRFVEGIDLDDLRFDPDQIRARRATASRRGERHRWAFDPSALAGFRSPVARDLASPAAGRK